MRILVSGSHGLVGTALIKQLEGDRHEIFRLVRHYPGSTAEIEWSPDRYSIALARIEGFDAVVHLAGESIAEGRWTEEKKKRIRESRVKGTRLLADALANLTKSVLSILNCAGVHPNNKNSTPAASARFLRLTFKVKTRNRFRVEL